jgi:hypothetical protein
MIPKWPNFGSGIWVDFKNFCYWDIVLIYTCKNSIISSSSCVSCNGLGHDEVCASSWWICHEFMTYFLFQLHSTPLSLFSTPCVGCEKLGITDQPIWFFFYWHHLQKENHLKKIFDNSTKMVFTKLIWDKLHKWVAYIIYSPCEWNLNNIIIELHEKLYGEWKPCHMNIRVKLTHVEWISSTCWS